MKPGIRATTACEAAPPGRSADSLRTLQQAFIEACTLDVTCFKPGNVSVESPGHGMQATDFIASAQAAAVPICDPALGVGARILGAVQATRLAVGCNTNLGIVLLAAPLLHAHQRRRVGQDLRAALADTLAQLGRDDAVLAYRAIRLATPAGLGRSARHDVNEEPAVTLLEAMLEGASRDSIARQYADNFADVWSVGLPALRRAHVRWRREDAAVAAVYLGFLSAGPDSHVLRKRGYALAEQVRREAAACQAAVQTSSSWSEARLQLLGFDRRLKVRGINPGTSADLTVAVLLAERLGAASCNEVQPRSATAAGHEEACGNDQSVG